MQLAIDTSQLQRAIAALGAKPAAKACARALNRTADNAKTAMVKVVATDMGLKQGPVRERISVWKADAIALRAMLRAKTGRVPLIEFNARGPEPSRGQGRGVRAKLAGPSNGRYPRAFIATMRGGHRKGERGVLQRAEVGGQMVGRLPVWELFGPSIAKVFQNNGAIAQARATEMLAKNVEHEINYLVSQAKQ